MELYILRHGVAVPGGAAGHEKNDATRPLTPRGRRQLRKNCAALKKLKLDLDLILSSPFQRAKQTAEIVAARLKLQRRLMFSVALTPDGDAQHLIRELNALKPKPEKLLLVGHEPYLSGLISRLVTGGEELKMDFAKGGICKLEVEKLRFGKCAELVWLLTPEQMKLMR